MEPALTARRNPSKPSGWKSTPILRNQIGHDFSGYKTKTFLRRVQRRVQVVQLSTMTAYVARLRQDPAEAQALFRDLLINVTNFFRDATPSKI